MNGFMRGLPKTKIAILTCVLAAILSCPAIAETTTKNSTSTTSATNCNVDYGNNWVARENAKQGATSWDALVSHSRLGSVSGWFDKTSAVCGDTIGLHLSGNNRPVSIKIYRMGYYNGAYARLVYSRDIGRVPRAAPAIIAPFPVHLTTTDWPTSTTLTIDHSYPTGVYEARFDDGGQAGYAPFVIRNNEHKQGLLIVAADMTWESYNTWGGWSLYHGPNTKIYAPGRQVSFDRPYDRDGKSNFTIYDAGIVHTAESLGLNLSYTDDVYIDSAPSSLLGNTAIIYDGHAEYWSSNIYSASVAAVNSGVNLVFFGANDAFWRVRLEDNGRHIVCWKGDLNDPYTNDPNLVTNKWGQYPTVFDNSTLLGSLYVGIINKTVAYTVQDSSVWPIAGTGLKTGDTIAGVVGKEVETTDIGQGPAVQSFLTAQTTTKENPTTVLYKIGLTYYTTPSHAGVINVGTMGWVCSITVTCSWVTSSDAKTKGQVIAITKQILLAAEAGPLGLSHPEVSNIPARTTLYPICVVSCVGGPPIVVDTN